MSWEEFVEELALYNVLNAMIEFIWYGPIMLPNGLPITHPLGAALGLWKSSTTWTRDGRMSSALDVGVLSVINALIRFELDHYYGYFIWMRTSFGPPGFEFKPWYLRTLVTYMHMKIQ